MSKSETNNINWKLYAITFAIFTALNGAAAIIASFKLNKLRSALALANQKRAIEQNVSTETYKRLRLTQNVLRKNTNNLIACTQALYMTQKSYKAYKLKSQKREQHYKKVIDVHCKRKI